MYTQSKDSPIVIKNSGASSALSQWNSLNQYNGSVIVTGFLHNGRPHNLSWSSYYVGWGCGVQCLWGSVYIFSEKTIWTDDFIAALSQFTANGTALLCITDEQLALIKKNGVWQIWEEKIIVHECGSFPNYTHGPNNMNIIAMNFSKSRKKEFPVSWDKINKRKKKEALHAQENPVSGSTIRVNRDARGRFIRRQGGLSTAAAAADPADWPR